MFDNQFYECLRYLNFCFIKPLIHSTYTGDFNEDGKEDFICQNGAKKLEVEHHFIDTIHRPDYVPRQLFEETRFLVDGNIKNLTFFICS